MLRGTPLLLSCVLTPSEDKTGAEQNVLQQGRPLSKSMAYAAVLLVSSCSMSDAHANAAVLLVSAHAMPTYMNATSHAILWASQLPELAPQV